MVTARPEEIWTQSTARSDASADPGSGVRHSYFWFRLTRFLLEFRPASVIHSNNCRGGPQEFMIQYQPAYGSQVSSYRIIGAAYCPMNSLSQVVWSEGM